MPPRYRRSPRSRSSATPGRRSAPGSPRTTAGCPRAAGSAAAARGRRAWAPGHAWICSQVSSDCVCVIASSEMPLCDRYPRSCASTGCRRCSRSVSAENSSPSGKMSYASPRRAAPTLSYRSSSCRNCRYAASDGISRFTYASRARRAPTRTKKRRSLTGSVSGSGSSPRTARRVFGATFTTCDAGCTGAADGPGA